MPMSVTYATVNGRLVEETRNGVVTRYIPDTLGNVIKTTDANGNITSETTYWPYGEIRTQTGNNPSPFGFCGIWGYLQDTAARLYVRARYYRPALGRWQTVDPLWPTEPTYTYTHTPILSVDPNGKQVGGSPVVPVGRALREIIKRCVPEVIPSIGGCPERARRESNKATIERSERMFPGISPRGDTPRNAVDHCTSACWASLICGRKAADDWLNGRYELPDRIRGKTIDVHNNNTGFDCALTIEMNLILIGFITPPPRPSPHDCFNCCKQKYYDNQLRFQQ